MSSKIPSLNKIIFKCDQHAGITSDKLKSFYKRNEFLDTTLIVGSNRVTLQAHRVVLCTWSEYFLEIFRGDQSASKIELKEIDALVLKPIIDFMYSGSIELRIETIAAIVRTASLLKIRYLVDDCCKLIEESVNSSNCVICFRLAYELDLPTLKATSLESTYTHFEEISKDLELLMLSESELVDLLFNDNPHGDFEEDVVLALMEWINYDKLNRGHLAYRLLSKVRFQALTSKFILKNRKSMCKTVESTELICNWLQWHLSPETRSIDQKKYVFKPRKRPDKLVLTRDFGDGKINILAFNPKANSWSIEKQTRAPKNRRQFSTIVIEAKLFVVGGIVDKIWTNSVECLDLHTSEWLHFPRMQIKRTNLQCAGSKGYLFVVGQEYNKIELKRDKTSMEVYNFSTSEWQCVELLPDVHHNYEIASHNETLYLIDFYNGHLQSYNASSKKWTLRQIKTESLWFFGFAAVEGFLYIIGGLTDGQEVNTVKRYNLSNDSWTEMASLPHSCFHLRTRVFENKIVSYNNCIVYEYNLDTDSWNTLRPFSKNKSVGFSSNT